MRKPYAFILAVSTSILFASCNAKYDATAHDFRSKKSDHKGVGADAETATSDDDLQPSSDKDSISTIDDSAGTTEPSPLPVVSTPSMNAPVMAGAVTDPSQIKKTGPGCIEWETLSDPTDILCAGSVENVFKNLPDWLGGHFSLMKVTSSNQTATAANPRVIVYSPTSDFIIAASSKPSATSLEVIVYDQVKEEWKFGEIDFSAGANAKVENKVCAGCHGTPFHLIWADYPSWPGVMGVANGEHTMNKEEADFFNAAAAGKAEIPALIKGLIWQSPGTYKTGDRFMSTRKGLYKGYVETNMGLNLVHAYKGSRSLAAKVMLDAKLTRAQKLKPALDRFCNSDSEGAKTLFDRLGYDPLVYMNSISMSPDRPFTGYNPWDGAQHQVDYVAAEILNRSLKADTDLRSSFPGIVKLFENPDYQFMFSKSTADALTILRSKPNGIAQGQDFLSFQLVKYFKDNPNVCTALKELR